MQEKIMKLLSRNRIVDFFDECEYFLNDTEDMEEECLFDIEEIEFIME